MDLSRLAVIWDDAESVFSLRRCCYLKLDWTTRAFTIQLDIYRIYPTRDWHCRVEMSGHTGPDISVDSIFRRGSCRGLVSQVQPAILDSTSVADSLTPASDYEESIFIPHGTLLGSSRRDPSTKRGLPRQGSSHAEVADQRHEVLPIPVTRPPRNRKQDETPPPPASRTEEHGRGFVGKTR